MDPVEWALIDIETTGTRAVSDHIIEIAIVVLREFKIIEQWQSLIKPPIAIPLSIQSLTGITPKNLTNAPTFDEIAITIFNKLKNRLFVAHNARFDYAFIKNSLKRYGIIFNAKTLCTVKLSRCLFPDEKRHNMDILIKRLNLKVSTRHRALGDVLLLQQFIEICRTKFGDKNLYNTIVTLIKKPTLPPYLSTRLDEIPNTPGVYLFYGKSPEIPIYIGKSINLRTRILSHFSNDHASNKELKISQQVHQVKWIETSGELGALLLESHLIKEKMPLYNYRLRRNQFITGFTLEKKHNYLTIKITRKSECKAINDSDFYGTFRSKSQAEKTLLKIISKNKLCRKLCYLEKSSGTCFSYQLKKCNGACQQLESADIYNLRVRLALEKYKQWIWPFDGPIGIKESCQKNSLHAIHIINQWRHYKTISKPDEWHTPDKATENNQHTVDEIKLIQQYFKTKLRPEMVILLKNIENSFEE